MEIYLFRWDQDSIDHIATHGVTPWEVEDTAFEGAPYIRKGRYGRRYLYGRTLAGRYLFVAFILEGKGEAKVITARDMDAKEKRLYLKRGK